MLGVVLYLIATSSGAGWLYVVAAAVGATVLISALMPLWNVRNIEVTRWAPAVGTDGTPLRCSAEIRNTGRFTRHMLEIEDRLAGDTGGGLVPRLKRSASESFDYIIENPRRGVYEGGEITVRSGAPFGLFFRKSRRWVTSDMVIYPRTFEVAWLPDTGSETPYGSDGDGARVLRRGSGGEFWGVREYRPGDPARLIAWRRSAGSLSSGRLTVMEMAEEQRPPLTLSLNLDRRAPAAAREMAVSAAASLLLRALQENREVMADAGPQRLSFPENPDPDSILSWCASLEPSDPPQLTSDVEILPSVKEPEITGAGTVVLVSCAKFDGTGPWMTEGEEDEFVEKVSTGGVNAVMIGPDVQEPWRLS